MFEGAALLRQLVFHAHRRLGHHEAIHDAFRFELPQAPGEHAIADVGNCDTQLGEPHPSVEEQLNDRTGPPAANQLDRSMKFSAQPGSKAHTRQFIKTPHLTQATYSNIVTNDLLITRRDS
jgi:hypothetical protein